MPKDRSASGTIDLALEGVGVRLGGRELFAPITVRVAGGEVLTVMGESGSGKSTLLFFLCGALDPAFTGRGSVCVGGREITGLPMEKRGLGILFQDDLLFPHLSVGENLLFALPRGQSRAARVERAEAALEEAGLGGMFRRDPASLSGGQRARAALMRTLLSTPRALLLDEPFSGLDHATRESFRAFVFDHARAFSLPTLLVTHDPADAAAAHGPVIHIGPKGDPT